MSKLLALVLSLFAGAAAAQLPYQSRQLPPMGWDLRAGLEADGLLGHAGGQLSADLGLIPLGEGLLAAGLEAGFSRCLLACRVQGDVLADRSAVTPMARLLWHFPVGAQTSNVTEIDLYVLVVAGAAFTFQSVQVGGPRFERNQLVPIGGVGLGSQYFPGNGDVVFAGGELRVLYAPSTTPESAGGVTIGPWSLAGVRLLFTIGARI